MINRFRPLAVALLLVLPLFAAGCQSTGGTGGTGGTETTGSTSAATASSASLLFVQTASAARLAPAPNGTDEAWILTLEQPAPNVTYFTDRPFRRAGTVSLDAFLGRWSSGADSFASDPPNAALVLPDTDRVLVFAIRDPSPSGSALRYRARLLEDSAGIGEGAPAADLAGRYGHVALFIDNLTMSRQDPMNRRDDFGRER